MAGLPMAYRLLQLHGGSIDLESKPGKGTSLHLKLPGDGRGGILLRPGPRLAMLLLVALCVSNVACWWFKKPARATCPTAPPAFLQRNSIMPGISSGIITDSRHGANTRLRSALFLLAMMRSRNSSVPASTMPLPTASALPCTAPAPRRTALPPRPAAKKNAAANPNPAGYRQEQRATREQPKTAENGPPLSLGQMFSQEERAELTQ